MDQKDADHCLVKIDYAVAALATGKGRIKERLLNVFPTIVHLSPERFPEGKPQDTCRKLHERITAIEPKGNEGNIKATLSKISEDKASDIAQLVVDLERQIRAAMA